MDLLAHHLLSILIFLPVAGAIATALVPLRAARWTAAGVCVAVFVLTILLLIPFDRHNHGPYTYHDQGGVVQLVERSAPAGSDHLQYLVGLDGISFPMIALTALLFPLAVLIAWEEADHPRLFLAMLLLLESASLGLFLALDLSMLIACFAIAATIITLLIGRWGGPRREFAAIKYALYMILAAVLLIVAAITIYRHARTLDLIELPQRLSALLTAGGARTGLARSLFVLLVLGFVVVGAVAPLHAWLPETLAQSPPALAFLLSGMLLRFGAYGVLRVAYPLLGAQARAMWPLLAVLGILSLIGGAMCAMAQSDLKRMLAYLCISQQGLVLVGISAINFGAVGGALFLMVAQGVIAAMLCAAFIGITRRAGHSDADRLGGLAGSVPRLTAFSIIALLANLGLPGLCGFVGQFLVVAGLFQATGPDQPLVAGGWARPVPLYALGVLACVGLVLGAAWSLWTLQRLFLRPAAASNGVADLRRRELLVLSPLAVLALLLGILPGLMIFRWSSGTIDAWLEIVSPRPAAGASASSISAAPSTSPVLPAIENGR